MPTMYETIRDLPLFKGIGEDQLSMMLEKTSMDFVKFADKEIIHSKGEPVRCVEFILGGKIIVKHSMENFPVEIEETLGNGRMIGALNLYGMTTTYPCSIRAEGTVSLMRIEKSQYLDILMSDKIYIINFVNYLSAAAQKGVRLTENQKHGSILETFDRLTSLLTTRAAEKIEIKATDRALADFCEVNLEEFVEWKEHMLGQHYISATPGGFLIKSPYIIR